MGRPGNRGGGTHGSDHVLDGIFNSVQVQDPGNALSEAGRQLRSCSDAKSVTQVDARDETLWLFLPLPPPSPRSLRSHRAKSSRRA